MNSLETARHRDKFRGQPADKFIASCSTTTMMVIAVAIERSSLESIIHNSTAQTIAATCMWLQERGVVIPADICATLEIEDIR